MNFYLLNFYSKHKSIYKCTFQCCVSHICYKLILNTNKVVTSHMTTTNQSPAI